MSLHNWREHWQCWLLDADFKPTRRIDRDLKNFNLTWKELDEVSFTADVPSSTASYALITGEVDQYLLVNRLDKWQLLAIQSVEKSWEPRRGKIVESAKIAGTGGNLYLLDLQVIQPDPTDTDTYVVSTGTTKSRDDAIKHFVRYSAVVGTAYNDPDDTARGIPGLSVAADKGQHTEVDVFSAQGQLWEELRNMALTITASNPPIDCSLTPTWNGLGAAVTFEFDTHWPRRGTDKTPGNPNAVVLSDVYKVLKTSAKHYNRYQYRTHGYSFTGHTVATTPDAGDHRRREIYTDAADARAIRASLSEHYVEETGHVFKFVESASYQLGVHFWIGDRLAHADSVLGLAAVNEDLTGFEITIADDGIGSEDITLIFGHEKPNITRNNGSRHRRAPVPGNPSGPGAQTWGLRDNAGTIVYPLAANNTIQQKAGTGMTVVGDPATNSLTFASTVTGGCYWQRVDSETDPNHPDHVYLTQRTQADDIVLLGTAGGSSPQFKIKIDDGAEVFHIAAAGHVHGAQDALGFGQTWALSGYGADSGRYRDFVFGGHDAQFHDILLSGRIVSIPTTTASGIYWLGGTDAEDFIWCHQITGYVENSSGAGGITEPATKRWALNDVGLTLYNAATNTAIMQLSRGSGTGGGAVPHFFKLFQTDGGIAFEVQASGDVLIYNDAAAQVIGMEAQHGGIASVHCATLGLLPDDNGTENVGRLNVYKGKNANANAWFFDGGMVSTSPDSTTAAYNFRIEGSTGNISKIYGIPYVFPDEQGAADTILKNDGSGNLTWISSTTYLKQHYLLGSYHMDTTDQAVLLGAMIVGQTSGETVTWQRLAAGTQNYVLRMGATIPGWSADYWTDSGTQLYPTTAGRDVLVRSATPTTTITLAAATGNATFAGTVTAWGAVFYAYDANTYLSRQVGQLVVKTDQAAIYLWNATHTVILGNAYWAPSVTNTISDGASAARWSNVYSILGNFSGQVTVGAASASPFALQSTATVVQYLDADKVDGKDETAFALLAGRAGGQTLNGGTAASENLTLDSTAHATKGFVQTGSVFKSTVANGTAPFIVASQTQVTNLNAYLLNGHSSATAATGNTICLRDASGNGTFAALGATTGTFSSTVSATQLTATVATGTAPFVVSSTTVVTNLNANLLNGRAESTSATGNTICLRDASGNGTFAALTCTGLTLSSGNITLSGAGATVDGIDISAFKSAYDSHYHSVTAAGTVSNGAITLSGKTDTYVLEGSADWSGTNLRKSDGTQLYMDATGHLTTTASGNTVIGTGTRPHTHNLVGGTYGSGAASQAASTFTGSMVDSGTPS